MIATTIRREIEELLSDGGKRSAHLTDQTMLADTGLDSMLLAILVTGLEEARWGSTRFRPSTKSRCRSRWATSFSFTKMQRP